MAVLLLKAGMWHQKIAINTSGMTDIHSVPNTVFFRRPWSFYRLLLHFGLILVIFLIKSLLIYTARSKHHD